MTTRIRKAEIQKSTLLSYLSALSAAHKGAQFHEWETQTRKHPVVVNAIEKIDDIGQLPGDKIKMTKSQYCVELRDLQTFVRTLNVTKWDDIILGRSITQCMQNNQCRSMVLLDD